MANPLEYLSADLRTSSAPSEDDLLDAFLQYAEARGFSMYPAQEEAILEVFAGRNVVLNTPTGSGKSLVALAAAFACLAQDKERAYYTAPIKALVTEKFFELCEVFGARQIGMMTGDATVNPEAPIVCCTAEILSNKALCEGSATEASWVIMDEFHYYSDRDRGVAWQIPLLTLSNARFLLMSATLGGPGFFVEKLEELTGTGATLVRSTERPVPLEWEYSERPLPQAIDKLLHEDKAPIYIVHFAQRAASEQAQNLMSLNLTSKEDKQEIAETLKTIRLDTAFGRELARFLPHGIGVHHAGMLPKYRRLVERMARLGQLRVICGTDTLGVGVNIPIRTVLFTQLCKYDGQKTKILSARELKQIAGRAGRRGFDSLGSVVVQAPEHEIENLLLRKKAEGASKKKKLHLKKPPERGYKAWNRDTLEKLREAKPGPMRSQMRVSHGILLALLSSPEGWRAGTRLLRRCHESPARKRALLHQAMQLFRSLLSAGIVSIQDRQVIIDEALQDDFSLHQGLSLYAVETFSALDKDSPDYALVLLSILEATLESPFVILRAQLSAARTKLVNQLKAEGVEYDARMEALEEVDYPKPEEDFIAATLQTFAQHHPWVESESVAPKSIAREMYEECTSFGLYVKQYGLARAEGVLLRYLSDCYRALRQNVPDAAKTDEVREIESWLGAEIRRVDASLLDEWERLESGSTTPGEATEAEEEEDAQRDLTRDKKALAALVRRSVFSVVQRLSAGRCDRVLQVLRELAEDDNLDPKDEEGQPWTEDSLQAFLAMYSAEHSEILTGADARSPAACTIQEEAGQLLVRQRLSDPEGNYDWALRFSVDLNATRNHNRVVVYLLGFEHP